MNRLLLSLFLLFFLNNTFGQQKKSGLFIEGAFMPSFAFNEDWTLDPDDDQEFLNVTGAFFRIGLGYEIKERFLISMNAGYDYHTQDVIHAFPTYVKLRYNITNIDDNSFYFQYSRGKMWRPAQRFADGDYDGFGLGYEIESDTRWNLIFELAYHGKEISGFEGIDNLQSISLGIGVRFR